MNEFIRKMMLHGRVFARGSGRKWLDMWKDIDASTGLMRTITNSGLDYLTYLKSNDYSSLYFVGLLRFYKNAPLCQLLGLGGRMWVADGDDIYELYGEKLDEVQRKLENEDDRQYFAKQRTCLFGVVPIEGNRHE